jgi:hypothetical protein
MSSFISRVMTLCNTVCSASLVRARASTNSGAASALAAERDQLLVATVAAAQAQAHEAMLVELYGNAKK